MKSKCEIGETFVSYNFHGNTPRRQNLSYCCSNKTIHLLTKKGNILLEQGLIKSDEEASSKKDRPRSSCSGKQEKTISRLSGKNLMAFYDLAKVFGRFLNLRS